MDRRRWNGNPVAKAEMRFTEFQMNRKIIIVGSIIFSAASSFGAPPAATERTPDTQSAIRIARSRPEVHPLLLQAYESYLAGDFAVARNVYQQVLASEPKNIDALHGMAAALQRQGEGAAAGAYYRRALAADPADAQAQVWLIDLQGRLDPLPAESRLKTLLAGQPELFSANYSLGNLYAAQNRWREAQTAYFRAYTAASEEPDILFNLAVSLDQLHQAEPAAHYYRLALEAAASRPAGFDRDRVVARLREIQH